MVSATSGRSSSASATTATGSSGGSAGRPAPSRSPADGPVARASSSTRSPRPVALGHGVLRCGRGEVGGEGVRSAEHPRAVVGRDPRPAQRGGERHLVAHHPGGARQARGQRGRGEVRGGGAAGQRPEHGLDLGGFAPTQRQDLVEREPSGGEGAGLVGADDVDVADRLDGVDLLHQRAAPGDPGGTGGVGDGDEEEQPVGHQSRQHGRDLHDPQQGEPLQRGLREDGAAHQHGQGHDQPDDELDAPLQRRLVGRGPAGLCGQPPGVARRPDVAGELVAPAGHAQAARAQLVAGVLDDRVGLAGEQRLVGLDPASRRAAARRPRSGRRAAPAARRHAPPRPGRSRPPGRRGRRAPAPGRAAGAGRACAWPGSPGRR